MMYPIGIDGKLVYVHPLVVKSCDTILYNISDDWDSVVIVTGDRKVRIGKTMLAQQIAGYLAYRLRCLGHSTIFNVNDVYFGHRDMIDDAFKKPKFSINLYDEGREGLSMDKSFTFAQRDLIDFFNEAGQLNQIFIIVMSDFFELKEYISIARSECLFNVWREDVKREVRMYKDEEKIPVVKWERGHFSFYNDKQKQILYDISKSKKQKNYRLVDVQHGQFPKEYIIDEVEYKKKKKEALDRFKQKKEESQIKRVNDKLFVADVQRMAVLGYTGEMMAEEHQEKLGYCLSARRYNQIKADIDKKEQEK